MNNINNNAACRRPRPDARHGSNIITGAASATTTSAANGLGSRPTNGTAATTNRRHPHRKQQQTAPTTTNATTSLGLISRAGILLLCLAVASVGLTLRKAHVALQSTYDIYASHKGDSSSSTPTTQRQSIRSTTTTTTTGRTTTSGAGVRKIGTTAALKPRSTTPLPGLIRTVALTNTKVQAASARALQSRRSTTTPIGSISTSSSTGAAAAARLLPIHTNNNTTSTTKYQFTTALLPPAAASRSENVSHWQRMLWTKQRALTSLQFNQTSDLFALDAPLQLLRVIMKQQQSSPEDDRRPVMAIITSTRSTLNHTAAADSLLVKHLMQSVLRSVSTNEKRHWVVHLYVAVDDTDTWWLNHWKEIEATVSSESSWLRVTLGVFPDRGHHIPFNEIAHVAYTEGADYFCRVNDDTEFKTIEWITHGVTALQQYQPPNIGVVGPKCSQGNTNIMTHDMVHRSHMDIFQGYYYPPAFGNWYLDDWISSVYGSNVLGPSFHRTTVLPTWIIRHWMYETRYLPDEVDSQWLPVEYERGRRLISDFVRANYPHNMTTTKTPTKSNSFFQMTGLIASSTTSTPAPTDATKIEIASSLPEPKRFHPQLVAEVLKVLPPDGNLLIWGLDMDSHFWHRATTGRVAFLEDGYMKKKFQRFVWRDYVRKSYPYLEYFVMNYVTPRGQLEDSYEQYVVGQDLNNSTNWCNLQFAGYFESLYQTMWDVVLVASPEHCTTLESCRDDDGPGVFQPLHMTKVIVANQTARARNDVGFAKHFTHVFVDDYDRKYEREFSKSVFAKEPINVLQLNVTDAKSSREHAHFVFHTDDRIARNIPYCIPPPIRDAAFFPADSEWDAKQVRILLGVLPTAGNMLIWGLGPESIFWHRATQGRVVFLEDSTRILMKDNKTSFYDYFTVKYPELEAYKVVFTTENNDEFYNRFAGHPNEWNSLEMNATVNALPDVVRTIPWHVILVDAPLGCCDIGPGRLQSIYMSKVLAESSQNAVVNSTTDTAPIVTHVFVDDFERKLEREFSKQVFDKSPISTIKRGKTSLCAHFALDKSDFRTGSKYGNVKDLDTRSIKVVRDRSAFPVGAQMGWNQVEKILAALPENGNLLVWGLGNDSPFWHGATTGRVVFLEDGSGSRNLVGGKRWFDVVTAANPQLEAFTVEYTTENTAESYSRLLGHAERWSELEWKKGFPHSVLETRWNVILVDAPLGSPNEGPGRYQSLYMTKLLSKGSQAVSRTSRKKNVVHVFVDEYERKVEREFSQQVFGKTPLEVVTRVAHDDVPANKQAHFVFGQTDDESTAAGTKSLPQTKTYDVIRDKSAFPLEAQMGWDQVKRILAVLPPDGNLLVWGLGNDSSFWSRTTIGKVIFLEDGTWETNLIHGKRWFDVVTAQNPKLEAYAVDYTSTNMAATYNLLSGHPEKWSKLEIQTNFPKVVRETRWDVILVDAPLGFANAGPGRYQSLYMTKLLAKKSESMPRKDRESVAEGGYALKSTAIHVFVDDFERKVEREFSQQVFGVPPLKVVKRRAKADVPENEQAHFVFGQFEDDLDLDTTDDTVNSILIPWRYPGQDEGQLSSPQVFPETWVVLVEVNNGYYDFFLNWLYHYNKLNLSIDVIVIAEDKIVKDKLEKEVIPFSPNVRLEQSEILMGPISLKYNTFAYKKLVSARATHILHELEKGINVIYTDVDAVWRINPLPYLVAAGEEADAILQVDTAKFNGFSPYYCTGFMAFVSNERSIQLMSDWRDALKKAQLNQPVFNEILHTRSSVKHQPLPKAEFPSGEFYFKKFNDSMRSKTVIVHNNYIQGFLPKKTRFQQRGLWKLAEWKKATVQIRRKAGTSTLSDRIAALFTSAK